MRLVQATVPVLNIRRSQRALSGAPQRLKNSAVFDGPRLKELLYS